MSNEPNITLGEAQAAVETKTAPRVTLDGIKSQIGDVRYLFDGTLTICIIEMLNGYKTLGRAAPADERNFDPEIGKRYAYEDALRSLWPVSGFLLCELLRPRPALQSVFDAANVGPWESNL